MDVRPAVALALCLIVVVAWLALRPAASAPPLSLVNLSPSAGPGATLVVHVTGAVVSPGLVELDAGSRVADAVDAAGGLAAGADQSAINLARVVSDGEQVYVPLVGEGGDGRININRADESDLDRLPGIGPALARRIVADRDAHGPYRSLDDLARVSGIGESILSQIATVATV